jgi:hypothetical protein
MPDAWPSLGGSNGALQGASAGGADCGADLMAIIVFGTPLSCHAFSPDRLV